MLSKNSNGLVLIISQTIEELKEEQCMKNINLAELERRTGITRARLRRWKNNNYQFLPHGRTAEILGMY